MNMRPVGSAPCAPKRRPTAKPHPHKRVERQLSGPAAKQDEEHRRPLDCESAMPADRRAPRSLGHAEQGRATRPAWRAPARGAGRRELDRETAI